MDVSNLELNAWTIWGLRHPQEEISVFMAIKEKIVVATALIAQIVDYLADVFAFQLRLKFRVGQQLDHIVHELAVGCCDTARVKYHSALTVLPLLAVWVCILENTQFLLKS